MILIVLALLMASLLTILSRNVEQQKSCVWVKRLICFGLLTLAAFDSDIYIALTLKLQ